MFEIAEQFLSQLISLLPEMIIIYIVFDFLGSFFFGKKWGDKLWKYMFLIVHLHVMKL